MQRALIVVLLAAAATLAACSATDNNAANNQQSSTNARMEVPPPTSALQGTKVIRVDPWKQDLRQTPAPTISAAPSENSWCAASRVTVRPDAYMCLFDNNMGRAPDTLCIRNPSAKDEYACLEKGLHWLIVRGLPFNGGEPPEHPGAQEANYVYLQLNDGTVCQPVQKSGMEHVGDYGFQGFCTDGTFYYSRFDTARPPSDDSNPFGEGTDSEGRWLLKTDRPNAAPGELVSRSVEVAYR